MEITLRKSGGYAGGEAAPVAIDTTKSEAGQRGELERLVQEADFFSLPEEVAGGVGADLFRYELTVKESGREHTVAFTEEGGEETAALRRLVERLEQVSG